MNRTPLSKKASENFKKAVLSKEELKELPTGVGQMRAREREIDARIKELHEREQKSKEKVALFVKEVEELEKKYHVYIGGCGCCGSPYIYDEENNITTEKDEWRND